MELGREVSWCELCSHERFLKTLTEERWGLTEAEGEVTVMVEDEAEERADAKGSYLILPSDGDDEAVAVGASEEGLDQKILSPALLVQMSELEDLLRDAARKAGEYSSHKVFYDAEKALFRCVDQIKRFNDEYQH